MANTKADKKTRDDLFKQSRELQKAAMSGRPIPMPQRTAMKGQAQALFEQWIELEAARFNSADSMGSGDSTSSGLRITRILLTRVSAFIASASFLFRCL